MTQEQHQLEQEERRQFEQSEMEDYHKKQYEWECHMDSIKPREPQWSDYRNVTPMNEHIYEQNFRAKMEEYQKALAEWKMMCSCDAPNKPGYYRANND